MVSLDIDALKMVASGNLGGAREYMDKMLDKQRERDIKEWIDDNVDLSIYEHESLDSKKAGEFLQKIRDNLTKAGETADPVEMLKDQLSEYLYDAYQDYMIEEEDRYAEDLSKTFGMPLDEARDWISENAAVSYPIDDYLDDTYNTVIMIDTGDSNYDFTLNLVEPAWDGDPVENISDEASLVWLAEQNGYSKDEFVRLMQDIENIPKDEHPFIHTVQQELANTSSHMNGVVFIGQMSLADLALAQKEGVTVPKRTPCGLYDGWNGAGGPLEIELQKDIVVPKDVTLSILPDCTQRLQFEVDSTYGFTNKKWETPLFAGEAKAFEPEQMEKAQKLLEVVAHAASTPSSDFEHTPDKDMEVLFGVHFKSSLQAEKEYPFYDGMLDRGQLANASVKALDKAAASSWRATKEGYRFSERHLENIIRISPAKIPDYVIASHKNHLEMLNRWKNER